MAQKGSTMARSSRPAGFVWRALAATVVLAGALAVPWQTAASAAVCQGWTSGQPPSPGTADNVLNGVTVLSACDAWAVGTTRSSGVSQTLIEHWDGSSWTVLPSPSPGITGNGLASVDAVSPADIWAVGVFSDNAVDQSLVLHWDGASWIQVPSPSPGSSFSELAAVAATSASDAWAVGDYSSAAGGGNKTLVLHWNGTTWAHVPSPNPASFNNLTGVTATSTANAWAVGDLGTPLGDRTLILHWTGTAWKQVPSPSPALGDDLTGVAATSATSAWAAGFSLVGGGASQTAQALVLHWNGSTWRAAAVPPPAPGASTLLSGITATSASSAQAVGMSETTTAEQDLILRWNGTAWTQAPAPSPGTLNTLNAVAATSATSAWAIGRSSTTIVGQALAIHCC
jgi:hypothetical protein